MIFSLAFTLSRPIVDPVSLFALLMLLILCVPLLCRFLRIPEIVGLIIAGIVLGPHALDLLPEGGAVELLGKVGLIYIMFQAGLEIDMNEFEENRSHSVIFGVLSYAFPMLLGSAIIYLFLHNHLNHEHLWPTILLLASVFASHTLLSQPIAKRLDIMKDPAVTTAIGGTIVTDTLTLMTLAVIAAIVQGDAGAGFWLVLLLGISVYTIALFLIIPRLSRWTFSKFKEGSNERFIYILAIVFLCAALAEVVKMEAIIGAFFSGLAINRLVPVRSPLTQRIHFVGETLFIPMFMITVGMIVDINSLLDPTMWGVAVVILIAVFATKIIAVFGSARLFSYTRDQAMVIFGLCVSQAAATLAATFIGHEIGLFNHTILNSIIMLILVTCLLSPWITERWGRKVALQAETGSLVPSRAPQRLLIPLANPASIESLMTMAILLHNPKSEEPLYPLTVVSDDDENHSQVRQAEKKLENAVRLANAANLEAVPLTRVDYNVADGIIRALTERRIRTVLIGWNGHITTDRFIFGSVLDRLLVGSEQTVFVYRDACPISEHQRVILLIPPFSNRLPGFHHVLMETCTLCEQLGAALEIITPSDSRLAAEEAIARIKTSAPLAWHDLSTWDHMPEKLAQNLKPRRDLMILVASRKRTISWTRENDRLPGLLATRFPENSFMVAYSRNQRAASTVIESFDAKSRLRDYVDAVDSPLSLSSINASDALHEITTLLPSHLRFPGLAERLIESARSNSVRVIRGTALIDVHAPEHKHSFVVVGNSIGEPVLFTDLKESVYHIWILVTGVDNSIAEHEALYGFINQRIQRYQPADLKAVHTAEDIKSILSL